MAIAIPVENEDPVAQLDVVKSDTRVQAMSAGAYQLLEQAQSIRITDPDSDRAAVEFILQVKESRKSWDKLRHFFTDPLQAQKDKIMAMFKADDEPMAQAERIVGDKHLAWEREQREKARKEQERLRKQAEARAARQAQKAEERGEEPPMPVIPMPTVAEPPKTIKTALGSLTTSLVWDFEVVNPDEVPDEFWVLDTVKIGKAVRQAGIRNIPGVRIFQTEKLGGRS